VSTLARYLVFQLPAWVIASGIALGLDAWTSLPRTWIGLALAAYVAKDFALFPYVRSAYESVPHQPGSELMGARGVVVVPLDPEGWVEIRHERWRARAQEPAEPIEAGAHVQVRGLRGSVVLVDREE
jgi:membrane protein implicated in regulation of membrane protease activity